MNIFRRQKVEHILSQNKQSKDRSLGTFDLILMSIGAVIGTGVMVLTGVIAARNAGPAVSLSFIGAGISCIFIVLCYAEFSSTIPSAGSSYSYVYVSLGELCAYLVGLCIVFGYILSISTVSAGWSAYFVELLKSANINLPISLTKIPSEGGIINLPAIFVILLITFLLSQGTKESKKVNNLMVLIKLGVIVLFLGVGVFFIHSENWHPFSPFGLTGIFTGASSVFFAFTGFDTTASAAEEVKDPKKSLPISLITSLLICTGIYVIVSLVLTGIALYNKLDVADALSYALILVGQTKVAALLSVGAVIGIMAVIFADAYGSSRILLALGRDKLLPKYCCSMNTKNAPVYSLWIIGILSAVLGGFVNLTQLANLANMCLLSAYFLVCLSLIVFRKLRPDIKRGFTTPFVPFLPILAMICCAFLIFHLPKIIWLYFGTFIALSVAFYFLYSYKNSSINNLEESIETEIEDVV